MTLPLLSQNIARQCILTPLPRGSTSSRSEAKVPIHLDHENDCNPHEARLRSHQGCVSTFGAWPWHLQNSKRSSVGRASVRWPTSPFPLESTNAGYCRGSRARSRPLYLLTRQSPTGRTSLPCCLCELWLPAPPRGSASPTGVAQTEGAAVGAYHHQSLEGSPSLGSW